MAHGCKLFIFVQFQLWQLAQHRQVETVFHVLGTFECVIELVQKESQTHPDHQATGRLTREAWFLSGLKRLAASAGQAPHRPRSIYHYLSHTLSAPTFVVDVGDVWERKLEAVRCYASQLAPHDADDDGSHFLFGANVLERMETKARYFGERIGVRYGEPLIHVGPVALEDPLVPG